MNNPVLFQARWNVCRRRCAILYRWRCWPSGYGLQVRGCVRFSTSGFPSTRFAGGDSPDMAAHSGNCKSAELPVVLRLDIQGWLASAAHSFAGKSNRRTARSYIGMRSTVGARLAREGVSPDNAETTDSLVVAAPTKFKQIPPLLLARLAVGAHAQRARLAHRRSRFALGDAGFGFGVQGLSFRRTTAHDR